LGMEKHAYKAAIAAVCLVLLAVPSFGAFVEHYQYVREEAGERVPVQWMLEKEKKDCYTLKYDIPEVKSVTVTDDKYATMRWSSVNASEGTDVKAERKNNTVHVKGIFKKKPIDRAIEIDEDPWFQATTLSLRSFVLSEKETMTFWILRPSNLKPYKLVARKEMTQTRDVLGQTVSAQKVSLSPPGLLAALWKGEYWFKKDNGMLIECETPCGPPGSNDVVMRLTEIVR